MYIYMYCICICKIYTLGLYALQSQEIQEQGSTLSGTSYQGAIDNVSGSLHVTCITYLYTHILLSYFFVSFVNIQAIEIPPTSDAKDSSEVTQLERIALDVMETKGMCQALVKQQVAFEQQVTLRLDQMWTYIEELLMLTPAPLQNMQSVQEPFVDLSPTRSNLPETPLPQTSTPSFQPTEAATLNKDDSSTIQPDLHLPPSSLSIIRANSCSRENFASKLVRELFTKEERLSSNVKGVMGKNKFDEKKIAFVQKLTFENFPCSAVDHKKCWAKCIKAIDSSSRALNRYAKLTFNKENETPD